MYTTYLLDMQSNAGANVNLNHVHSGQFGAFLGRQCTQIIECVAEGLRWVRHRYHRVRECQDSDRPLGTELVESYISSICIYMNSKAIVVCPGDAQKQRSYS